MRILDAGCGSDRNIVYFLREGYDVYAIDPDVRAVESVRALARTFAPALPESNLSVEAVEHMSFDDVPDTKRPASSRVFWVGIGSLTGVVHGETILCEWMVLPDLR